jgi:hypothetical protein
MRMPAKKRISAIAMAALLVSIPQVSAFAGECLDPMKESEIINSLESPKESNEVKFEDVIENIFQCKHEAFVSRDTLSTIREGKEDWTRIFKDKLLALTAGNPDDIQVCKNIEAHLFIYRNFEPEEKLAACMRRFGDSFDFYPLGDWAIEPAKKLRPWILFRIGSPKAKAALESRLQDPVVSAESKREIRGFLASLKKKEDFTSKWATMPNRGVTTWTANLADRPTGDGIGVIADSELVIILEEATVGKKKWFKVQSWQLTGWTRENNIEVKGK